MLQVILSICGLPMRVKPPISTACKLQFFGCGPGENKVNGADMKPSRGVRALPDFLIIGAQKSATTSLLSYIGCHSGVRLGRKKTAHFFDLNFHKGVEWYAAHFPRTRPWSISQFFSGERSERNWLTGESCPSYMFLPDVPLRVRQFLPDVKLIVILRNPVDRLISQYQHERRKMRAGEDFEEFIAPSLAVDWPPKGDIETLRQRCAVPRGFYADQLRHWQTYFPAQRFLVLSFDELVKNSAATLNRVFEFLGLEPEVIDTSEVHNSGSGIAPPALSPDLRAQLESLYRQKNKDLAEITRQKFFWL